MLNKAVVLCAGEGKRLRPLTFSRPKNLLPVAGKPMLGWALEAIQSAGIQQVGMVVGHHAEAVRSYVGTGDAWGLKVEYIQQFQRLGLAHAVMQAREYVQDEPFLVYLGDNLFEDGIKGFVEGLPEDDWEAALLLKRVEDPRRFGVAEVDGDRVIGLEEKPVAPTSDLAVVGVYALQPSIFDAIDEILPSARGELEITDAIDWLIRWSKGPIRWGEAPGLWEDAGEPASLLRANWNWLGRRGPAIAEGTTQDCAIEGAVGVETGARAQNSKLIGPCLIGRNCTIEDSEVGPGVTIDEGCEVIGSRLQNCIVQRNSRISHVHEGLVDSVLGEHVQIIGRSEDDDGAPLRLLLGDMSSMKAQ